VNRAASQPPEARGLTRDGVRLLAATPDGLVHARFRDLPRFLAPGDLLVVNTSATLAAALPAQRTGGRAVTVHLSNQLDNGTWLVELRQGQAGPRRLSDGVPGEVITLPGGGSVTLLRPYPDPAATRIWEAAVTTGDGAVHGYLARHGQPIRYSYVPDQWPLTSYQTVFAHSPGSAEMPSAARPFSADLVTRLIAAGVVLAPITLHTGVASLEAGEAPLPEWFEVPQPTADLVNLTLAAGRRVIAVGTTCTRALESAVAGSGGQAGPVGDTVADPVPGPVGDTVADPLPGAVGDTVADPLPGPVADPVAATVTAASGWTSLVLGPEHPARVVTGLITGWHEAGASHLALLEAVAGRTLVEASYREAEAADYLWHEFGDSCLLLPPVPAARSGARSGGWLARRPAQSGPAQRGAGSAGGWLSRGRPSRGPAQPAAGAAGSHRLMQPSSSSVSTGLVT
jgi:S-adenosylmethionine:tRNA ribosyltransferase-isomerase